MEPLGYPIDFLRRLAALRVLRLGRLARAVRIMPMFHEPRGEPIGEMVFFGGRLMGFMEV